MNDEAINTRVPHESMIVSFYVYYFAHPSQEPPQLAPQYSTERQKYQYIHPKRKSRLGIPIISIASVKKENLHRSLACLLQVVSDGNIPTLQLVREPMKVRGTIRKPIYNGH